jgi:hypothetical protein
MPKPPLPKGKARDKYAKFRCTENEYNYIVKQARKNGKQFSQFVRDAIAAYIHKSPSKFPDII